jgi:hypothetical protein
MGHLRGRNGLFRVYEMVKVDHQLSVMSRSDPNQAQAPENQRPAIADANLTICLLMGFIMRL